MKIDFFGTLTLIMVMKKKLLGGGGCSVHKPPTRRYTDFIHKNFLIQ